MMRPCDDALGKTYTDLLKQTHAIIDLVVTHDWSALLMALDDAKVIAEQLKEESSNRE